MHLDEEFWTFFFMAVVLKIPLIGLGLILWWALKSPECPKPAGDTDGGTRIAPIPSPSDLAPTSPWPGRRYKRTAQRIALGNSPHPAACGNRAHVTQPGPARAAAH